MSQANVTSNKNGGSEGVEEQRLQAGKQVSVTVQMGEEAGSHATDGTRREPSTARRGEAEEGDAHPTLIWHAASWRRMRVTFLRVRSKFPRWTFFPAMFFT